MEFFKIDGGSFDLLSVDLAEYSTFFAAPQAVTFVGVKADGSTMSTTFTTDGIIDGTGPLPDFETFQFSGGFQQLVRVDITTTTFSMDNVTVVPEPSSLALGLFGCFVALLGKFSFLKALREEKVKS